ncbi:MAG: pyrimidine dimer DNA glycosylase/endonuclease V [Bacteroidales bacterium]|nr:pyrimidine dimer DNA glycosylase/endonuclease V [Bacteroidales bacterium]MCF8391243.1 pyrimidine dimer DNA glycosylase/endonuclease V [Bacteroidales bacterium]
MRIWSLHPEYLDVKALVALWRETLLAKNVLEGNTKGYKNHPQLNRFKKSDKPLAAINKYLEAVYEEALKRGYHFNKDKFNSHFETITLVVTKGQMEYETRHLLNKLKIRDYERYQNVLKLSQLNPHPLFKIVNGEIEDWEVV